MGKAVNCAVDDTGLPASVNVLSHGMDYRHGMHARQYVFYGLYRPYTDTLCIGGGDAEGVGRQTHRRATLGPPAGVLDECVRGYEPPLTSIGFDGSGGWITAGPSGPSTNGSSAAE